MSNPTHPVYTFRVNLETLDRYSTMKPYTADEAANFKETRTSWLCSLFPGCNVIANEDGYTFTAYGLRALYLKNTYVTGSIDDVLQIVED